MNRTPRLRSSYPTTPRSSEKSIDTTKNEKITPPLSNLPQTSGSSASSLPVIPIHIIDAPSQRLYTSVLYSALLAYRLYDWWNLVEEDIASFSLFAKWCTVDLVFIFGVPLLRIPWLEWSETTSIFACLVHCILNGLLMFRLNLPLESWLLALIKTFFDREVSISETSVRPARVLHNSSLIMGKQIVNILPEGSVFMNPERLPFCLDSNHPVVNIPIIFNQTKPNHIELLRIDFETNSNETIKISTKEIKNSRKIHDENMLSIHYAAKKTGLYRLHKVIDNTKLEVQRRMSDTLVVKCPQAVIKSSVTHKCYGDLSNLTMEIYGTPPLKVRYYRIANGDRSLHHLQNIQPENFASPLIGPPSSSSGLATEQDVSWGNSHRMIVQLNESMMVTGNWIYSVDQIHDAVGNTANFSSPLSSEDETEHVNSRVDNLEKVFIVHERPVVSLKNCDSGNPMMVANGKFKEMQVEYQSTPSKLSDQSLNRDSYTINWKFSPIDKLTANGEHGNDIVPGEFYAHSPDYHPRIRKTGLYTITGVRNRYCEGIVKEPASCLLLNPPEPQLSIHAERISDNCAGNSVGLLVDLNFIGTPPFILKYDIITLSGISSRNVEVNGLRHQLELKPMDAGHFKYKFVSIDDQVYKDHSLRDKGLVLEQDVKPPAFADLIRPITAIEACLEEPVQMAVKLTGEKPFTLEYEIIHDGRRKKSRATGIETSTFIIKTDPLLKGGEYTLAITSVQDINGCKIFLESEAKFTVRRQRPRVAFGKLEGDFKIIAVEGKSVELPIRLTGRPPWTLKYLLKGDETSKAVEKVARLSNDVIVVNQKGKYELLEVSDDQCPGNVDIAASQFEINWFPRPQIHLGDKQVMSEDNGKYVKREVCENDVDTIRVNLFGSPPYNVRYQVLHKSSHGSSSVMTKEFEAAAGTATIPLDTASSGTYEYTFLELSDALYDHDGYGFAPLVIQQQVNKKPSAHFSTPGKTYKYCEREFDRDEAIPIHVEGVPPFSLELDIKHQSSLRPETVKVANIETNLYEFRIPHSALSHGTHHVTIRKVRDSFGCQQKNDYGAPHVQAQVYHAPTIHPLDSKTDYCVGDRISYSLSGVAPFEIFYDFEGVQRRAKSFSSTFKRFAEKPGIFTITGLTDKSSECRAKTEIIKVIHAMPTVKISKGRQIEVDIHEGAETEILFEFWGTPPFEFTYTRSTNARKGQKSQVLETRHEISDQFSKVIKSSLEGTYEVVAIKDKFCSFSILKDKNDPRYFGSYLKN